MSEAPQNQVPNSPAASQSAPSLVGTIGSELSRAGRALRSIVQSPAKVTWRAVARQWFWSAVIWPFGGVRVEGDFAGEGPYVVVANHGSHADTIAMMSASPTILRVVTVAAQDYWFTRSSRRLIARGLLGAYPVRRDGEGAYEELRGELANRVAESMSVLIFPEGTRTTDGQLGRFHTGAARLARDFGIPVLPVALVGSRELLPKKGGLPRFSPVELRVGEPITASDDVEAVTQAAQAQVEALLSRTRRPFPVSDVHTVLAGAMSGWKGDAIMFTWGMAEALSFPIMAEMSQVWLGVTQPQRLWRRGAAVVAGSVTGVAIGHLAAGRGLRLPAPWTTAAMRTAVAQHLDAGARGYWQQALTGIPVKLFAAESGRRGLPLGPVLAHAAGERAARMYGSTAFIRVAEKPLGNLARQHYGAYLAGTGLVFAVLLRKVIRHWER
ncbi:2-acyl-glycerophospho-ethanolamine acyltransferase [Actinomyces bovis]|uniref:2-acyl-glycerophospho-ethanolamine acyltransferase n=1 Tax=Actinomyces bovis TaxID=1658 RepID=A0ABY1VQ72_9ACTO|nr:lysophospholipid acyltransferase family protein [Actinomyces bovis]SPT54155.1 2-acyl-glycerophospho-ethanolamine acyltransferase [Actinomyces bovis]VEG53585.1 2-acyl-glycerophospho-ethanolamine acyltransferase [Actinomyces israelii]